VKRPGWLPERLYPFQSHFAQVAGWEVHYVDGGSGPSLLLVHGNPTWSCLYGHIIRALAPDFRCIAPDLPGFGVLARARGHLHHRDGTRSAWLSSRRRKTERQH